MRPLRALAFVCAVLTSSAIAQNPLIHGPLVAGQQTVSGTSSLQAAGGDVKIYICVATVAPTAPVPHCTAVNAAPLAPPAAQPVTTGPTGEFSAKLANQLAAGYAVYVTEEYPGGTYTDSAVVTVAAAPPSPANFATLTNDIASLDVGVHKAASPPAVPNLTQGEELTQSEWGSPDACAVGTPGNLAAKGILYVHRSLVLPKEASDDFGYRLGKRFVVYQVSVTNASTDFQYSVSDIMVDLAPLYGPPPKLHFAPVATNLPQVFQASSQDLLMLRGVPEKGQDHDPRNLTLHILQGIGAVGGGISGLTPFSDVMGSAMANFNGAFIQAFTGIAPDHTSTQLNRLSDMAFTSNTLIGKLQTKKFAIFIPEAFVMPKGDPKKYWSDPRSELDKLPFDQLNVCVDGILLVQAATTPDPTISTPAGNVASGTSTAVASGTSITLADSDTGAVIYYTIDGTTPTTKSTKYSAPISITPPETIKAIAVSPSEAPSNTVSASFTLAAAGGGH